MTIKNITITPQKEQELKSGDIVEKDNELYIVVEIPVKRNRDRGIEEALYGRERPKSYNLVSLSSGKIVYGFNVSLDELRMKLNHRGFEICKEVDIKVNN